MFVYLKVELVSAGDFSGYESNSEANTIRGKILEWEKIGEFGE